ncbi:MAG: glycosyltransferase [Candidatus Margulisbacteria bacterium]|nr:glycosyltransferase [Candidatus Margulisiibacteriota bacterium]
MGNNTEMPVTIFVAVKNKREIIEKCIDSLLGLDWPNKEIIVIDNLSTDGSYEALLKYGDRINLHRLDGGLSKIFNRALDLAKNEYFICTDADCVVDREWAAALLAPFVRESGLAATAGFCGTPESANYLQRAIGLELENRYKKFPKYIDRAPTMNLCFKTETARQVRFDESFTYQAFEVDFCYRLAKYGKILYVPGAIVRHYHRSNILAYVKQQRDQAKWGVKLLFKHGRKAAADQITTFGMSLQIVFLLSGLFFYLLSFLFRGSLYVSMIFMLLLIASYIKNIAEINPAWPYYPVFFALFFIRTCSWAVGSVLGLFYLAKRGA